MKPRIFAILVLFALAPAGPVRAGRLSEIAIPRERAGLSFARLLPGAPPSMIVAGEGSIRIYPSEPGKGYSTGSFHEFEAAPAMYDVSDPDGDGAGELILLGERGVDVWRIDAASRKPVKDPKPAVEEVRGPPLQHLVPADFIFDIDGDGREDMILPLDGRFHLYFRRDGGWAMENRVSTRPVKLRLEAGEPNLRGKLEAYVAVPRPSFSDVNGDGRLDLRVSRDDVESFFLQSASGEIPETASYEIPLKRFKERIEVPEGRIKTDQFQFIPMDLDADGLEDYTIVAGNKIWVFRGRKGGPDLEKPDQILKVGAPYMRAMVMPVHGDPLPDLVVMKYDIPSLGRFVAGLAIGLRFEIEILGYGNRKGGLFSRSPDARSAMVFKIPPLLKLLGEMEDLTAQFRDIQKRGGRVAGGDFNGDGVKDVAMLEKDRLNLYLAETREAGEVETSVDDFGDEAFYRRVLFGEKVREVTIDTLLKFFSDTVNSMAGAATAGRAPSESIPLDPALAARCETIDCRDLDGDGKADAILHLGPPPGRQAEEFDEQTLLILYSGSAPR